MWEASQHLPNIYQKNLIVLQSYVLGRLRAHVRRPRDVQGKSKGDPREIQGTPKGHPKDVQGTSKGHPRDVQRTSKGCPRDVQGTFNNTNNTSATQIHVGHYAVRYTLCTGVIHTGNFWCRNESSVHSLETLKTLVSYAQNLQ